eukprot:5655831-Ditylum_brightwellii.AAC.1
MFTNDKGIWTIEMTKDTLHQAMGEIDKGVETLQDILSDEHFTKNPAFPVPSIIHNYGVSRSYADKMIQTVPATVNKKEKGYNQTPQGA